MYRYWNLIGHQLKRSLLLAAAYRVDFTIAALFSLLDVAAALIPLFLVFEDRPEVVGWTQPQMLLVMAWFFFFRAMVGAAIEPNVRQLVEHIRKGTLDFVLLKPVDAQFLVSTGSLEIWPAAILAASGITFAYAFYLMGTLPTVQGVLMAMGLVISASLFVYAVWMLLISSAFYVTTVQGLMNLFDTLMDAARWPKAMYRGALGFIFTFILPFALMTTLPAEALLGRVVLEQVAVGLGSSLMAATLARLVWKFSLRRYASASS